MATAASKSTAASVAAEKMHALLTANGLAPATGDQVKHVDATYGKLSRQQLWDCLGNVCDLGLGPTPPDKLTKTAVLECLARMRTVDPATFDAEVLGGPEEENPEGDHEEGAEEVEEEEEEESEAPPSLLNPRPLPKAARSTADAKMVMEMAKRMEKMETTLSTLSSVLVSLRKDQATVKAFRKAEPKDTLDDILSENSETDEDNDLSCAQSLKTHADRVTKRKRQSEDNFLYAHIALRMKKKEFTDAWNNLIRDFRIKKVKETPRDEKEIILLKANLIMLVEIYATVKDNVPKYRIVQRFVDNTEYLLLTLQKIASRNPVLTVKHWNEALEDSKKKMKLRKIDFLDYTKMIRLTTDAVNKEAAKERDVQDLKNSRRRKEELAVKDKANRAPTRKPVPLGSDE